VDIIEVYIIEVYSKRISRRHITAIKALYFYLGVILLLQLNFYLGVILLLPPYRYVSKHNASIAAMCPTHSGNRGVILLFSGNRGVILLKTPHSGLGSPLCGAQTPFAMLCCSSVAAIEATYFRYRGVYTVRCADTFCYALLQLLLQPFFRGVILPLPL
jgi:hypothetical protein